MTRGVCLLAVGLFWVPPFGVCHAADVLKAGAATADITPPIGYAMWGYGARHDAPSVGVLDPLKARALVLSTGRESIALVSLDLGRSPTRQSTDTIRSRVKAAVGIEHLFLVASHTHHGPVLELDDWPTPKSSYVRQLEDKLARRYRPRRQGKPAGTDRRRIQRSAFQPQPPLKTGRQAGRS